MQPMSELPKLPTNTTVGFEELQMESTGVIRRRPVIAVLAVLALASGIYAGRGEVMALCPGESSVCLNQALQAALRAKCGEATAGCEISGQEAFSGLAQVTLINTFWEPAAATPLRSRMQRDMAVQGVNFCQYADLRFTDGTTGYLVGSCDFESAGIDRFGILDRLVGKTRYVEPATKVYWSWAQDGVVGDVAFRPVSATPDWIVELVVMN
jgi:hypothetical protein